MRKYLIYLLLFVISISSPAFAAGGTGTSVPAICANMDAEKMVQEALNRWSMKTDLNSGTIDTDTGAATVYNDNKWIVSCAVAYGLTGMDNAVALLKSNATQELFRAKLGIVTAGSNPVVDTPSGSSSFDADAVRNSQQYQAMQNMTSSLEDLSKSNIFGQSIFSRTYQIGLYLICFTFLVSLGIKVYGMVLGKSNIEPIDLIFYFIRLITLIALMSFMRPLVFFGMGLSTDIANMLLKTPITSTIMSGVLYNSNQYQTVEDMSGYNPWLQSSARVSSTFGAQDFNRSYRGGHRGVDYAVNVGTPIYAPVDGIAAAHNDTKAGGFGYWVSVTADTGESKPYIITHRAGHLSEIDPKLIASNGTYITNLRVHKGEVLGKTGKSGTPVGGGEYKAHLHADVRVRGGEFSSDTALNPAMVYDFHDGVIPDLSGNYVNNAGTGTSGSGASTGTNTTVQSTNQGSYTVTGEDSLTMASLFSKMIELKYELIGIKGNVGIWDLIKSAWSWFGAWTIGNLAKWMANVVLTVLIVLSDVLMALTIALGPFVIALSLIPQFENFLQQWIKGYLTFLFYQPLASCFQILSIVMMAVTLDSGITPFLILCICYVGACMKIPNIADGLSTAAVMGTASMLAFAPAMLALKVGPAAAISSAAHKVGIGGNGRIRTKLVMLVVCIGIILSAVSCSCAATLTNEEKKAILEIGTETEYPSQEMLNAVKEAVSNKTGTVIAEKNIHRVDTSSAKDPSAGIYNTAYQNAIDTPMVRYVLGSAKINAAGIYDTSRAINLSKFGVLAGKQNLTLAKEAPVVQTLLDESQNAIGDLLMKQVPLYILFLMFFLQLACIGYLKFTNEEGIGSRISYLATLPRLVCYILAIFIFPHAVSAAITMSNYISNAIVPIESQELLMSNITAKTGSLVPGDVKFDGLIVWVFRALTYMAIKILLIARDMFLCVSIIVGPICIALGYFTRFRDPDYVHQFYTGWLESFIKILFWGPLAAIMLFCLGSLSVLTSMDMLSTFSTAVTGLAFLYAAGNLPNMAEKMSAVAVMGMLTAMTPFLMFSLHTAGRGALMGGWKVGSGLMSSNLALALAGKWSGMGGVAGILGNMLSKVGNNGGAPFPGAPGGAGGNGAGGSGNGGTPQYRRAQANTSGMAFVGGLSKSGENNDNKGGNRQTNLDLLNINTKSGAAATSSVTASTTGGAKADNNLLDILGAAAIGAAVGAAAGTGAVRNNNEISLMKSSLTGHMIRLSANINDIKAASASVLHSLNINGDINEIRSAISDGNFTELLYGENALSKRADFDAKMGLTEVSDVIKSASFGIAMLGAGAMWSKKMGNMYGDSGFNQTEVDNKIVVAQQNIEAALAGYQNSEITGAEAASIVDQQIIGVAAAFDKNTKNVHENVGNIAVPQAPTFGSCFMSQGLGGNKSLSFANVVDNSYEKIDMTLFTTDVAQGSLYSAVMGENGLLHNNNFMSTTGLEGENETVRVMTTGMTGIAFAKQYIGALREDNRIDDAAYNSAMSQITDVENRITTIVEDYGAGNLTMDAVQTTETVSSMVTQVSGVLDQYLPQNNGTPQSTEKRVNYMQEMIKRWDSSSAAWAKFQGDLRNVTNDGSLGENPHIKSSANDYLN